MATHTSTSKLSSLKNRVPGGAMRFRLLVIFSASALLLAACGGENGGPTAATLGLDAPGAEGTGAGDDAEATVSVGGPTSGGNGTMAVDGEPMNLSGVVRCIPFDGSAFGGADGDPNEIDLAIVGVTGGLSLNSSTMATLNAAGSQGEEYDMSINRLSLSLGVDQYENVAGTLVDGTWILGDLPIMGNPGEGTAIDGPPFIVDGNNISGAMTLVQTWPEGADGTVNVTFDVTFPSEAQEC